MTVGELMAVIHDLDPGTPVAVLRRDYVTFRQAERAQVKNLPTPDEHGIYVPTQHVIID